MTGETARLSSWQALAFGARLTWRSNPRLAVGVVSLQALEAVIPAATLFLISRVVGRSSAHATFAELAPYLLVLALLAGLMTTLSELAGWRSDLLGDHANDSAQSRLAERAASASLAEFDDSSWHDALARARAGAVHRPNEIAFSGVLLVKAIAGLAAMAGLLVSIDPLLLGLAVLAAVPGYVIRKRLARARYDVMYESVHERREAEYLDRLLTDPKDAVEVRAFQMEPALLARSRSLRQVDLARKRAVTSRENRLQLPAALAAALIFAAAYLIIGDRAAHSLSAGSLVTLLGSFSAIIVGIDGAAQTLGTIESHRGFISDLHAFIGDLRPTVEKDQSPQAFASPTTLRVEGVSFGYAGRAPALSEVTADFAAGTLTVLVGRNGAGKSTLLKVLNAQYAPDAGLVTVDGVVIASYPASAWRRAVAYLPQDAMRIELSLRDAVGFGDASRHPTDADVAAAFAAGQADVVQKSLGRGLDAPLGQLLPGARNLSGGQWQRVAASRFFFRQAPVWLLDEPTANLDPQAELQFMRNVREHLGSAIGILVTHRLAAALMADRVIVLDQGSVLESGVPSELRNRDSLFRQLFQDQREAVR